MGSHIMKTTIEISDPLFKRTQALARKEKTTLRALTEQGLRLLLKEKQTPKPPRKWQPVIRGSGLHPEFRDWNWEKIRGLIYEGR